jgi:hypothetical protein
MTRLFSRLAITLLAVGLLFPGAALAVDFVWTTETVKANRFMDTDSAEVGEFESGKRVEVIFTEGERLRVRVGGATFGWIDKAKTTDTEPAKDPAESDESGDEPDTE